MRGSRGEIVGEDLFEKGPPPHPFSRNFYVTADVATSRYRKWQRQRCK